MFFFFFRILFSDSVPDPVSVRDPRDPVKHVLLYCYVHGSQSCIVFPFLEISLFIPLFLGVIVIALLLNNTLLSLAMWCNYTYNAVIKCYLLQCYCRFGKKRLVLMLVILSAIINYSG